MKAALSDDEEEARSLTVSNLMFDDGPQVEFAVPLLSIAMNDDSGDIRRLAESALSSLGSDLTRDAAEGLEATVEGSPDELAKRILLLSFYFLGKRTSTAARDACQAHILWVIRNAPASATAGSPYTFVSAQEDPTRYTEAKNEWLKQLALLQMNATVLGNAASFFTLNDNTFAESLYLQAKALEPHEPNWPWRLGHLHALQSNRTNSVRSRHAKLALNELRESEQIRRQVTPEQSSANAAARSQEHIVNELLARLNALPEIAKAAFEAGEFAEAERLAVELLAIAVGEDLPEFFRNEGNVIHHGNLVLGRCQLRRGDIEKAKVHLLEAGKTEGSPQLNSFGPNMSLALDLLECGERKVVLDYFELCRSFWNSGSDRLDVWADKVSRGQVPLFGPNLSY